MDIQNQHLIEEFSNISAGKCEKIKQRYVKAAAKGKDSKEARNEAKLLGKCKGLVDFSDIPELNTQANPQTSTPKMGMKSIEVEQPIPEKKILGMKKGVAIPVIIGGSILLIIGGIFAYRKFIKK